MKTKLIILVTLLFVICTGCKKHECAELSWTDYNSVEDVYCNFQQKEEEMKSSIRDTLKVFGWMWKYGPYLIADKDRQNERNSSARGKSIYLRIEPASLMPTNPYDTLLYVTGIIEYSPEEFVSPYSLLVAEIKKQ